MFVLLVTPNSTIDATKSWMTSAMLARLRERERGVTQPSARARDAATYLICMLTPLLSGHRYEK